MRRLAPLVLLVSVLASCKSKAAEKAAPQTVVLASLGGGRVM